MGILTLGPKGTFSHEATLRLFPKKKIVFASSINEVFFRLADKEISAGVIPLENSQSGLFEETISNLMKYDFSILGKTTLRLSYLLAGSGDPIEHLYADRRAFDRCRVLLKKKCPDMKLIETASIPFSALQLKASPEKSAALVSRLALEQYTLPLLAENMEEDSEIYTTFFAIGKTSLKKKEKNGTAFLLFSDEVVALQKQISENIRERKLKLLKMKNLLLQEGHTPLYFIEVEGHLDEKSMRDLFEELSEKYLIKHLGSYPL